MRWGLNVRAADPIQANREWVPILKGKRLRHIFDEREAAQAAMDAMLRGNNALELQIVPIQETE